jgi:monofunctional biosynthetic peptidoglycan transglycosylase
VLSLAVVVAVAPVPPLLLLRFVAPPTTSFMIQRRVAGGQVDYRPVPWERMSPWAPLAVMAAEDQRFLEHNGFDFDSIADALEERERRRRVRGASTVTQQLAKNLFLWPGRSLARKALEGWLTVWIELLWPKRRILETYLNVAEMGDGVFGVEAASRRFFEKSAAELDARDAALLAAVLPSPARLRADAPSPWVRERSHKIRTQMDMIGGPARLRELGKKEAR